MISFIVNMLKIYIKDNYLVLKATEMKIVIKIDMYIVRS